MNVITTEKIINRTCVSFVLIVILAGVSSWRGGPGPAVYQSIFVTTSIYLGGFPWNW